MKYFAAIDLLPFFKTTNFSFVLHSNSMFSLPTRYFKRIKCPNIERGNECPILGCIFQHENSTSRKRVLDTDPEPKPKKVKSELPSNATNDSNETKSAPTTTEPDIFLLLPQSISHISIPRNVRIANVSKIVKFLGDHPLRNKEALKIEYEIAVKSKTLQEYNTNIEKSLVKKEKVEVDPKYILPTQVNGAPATLPARKKIIELFVDAIKKHYPEISTPILRATDEEYKIATTTTSFAYNQVVRNRLQEINLKKLEKETEKPITEDDYYKYLSQYEIPIEQLEKFGYVVSPPEAKEPKKDKICKRCNNPFNIDNQLIPTECHFHSGKIRRRDTTKYYECCGAVVDGDAGPCSFSKHHVFYWENVQEMQWAIPFQNTRDWNTHSDSFKAIGIDCEMGYTTRGFELLRITAIDFFSGEEVIDLMVKPKGTVVDLNTRWSGISAIGDDAITFEDLMQLLGSVMDKNTILVGHGLENDLNSMRLIHERIVDTAILFPPHKATPRFRYSLKDLAFKYLSRNIQTGEHDSSEDSLAAIDITKYFIKQKIKQNGN